MGRVTETGFRVSPPPAACLDTGRAGSFPIRPLSFTRCEPSRYLIFNIFFEIDIEPNRTLQK
jgi:hypothetical protein